MIQTGRLLKVSLLWMSISYLVCYLGVALIPDLRSLFFLYALHSTAPVGEVVFSPANFVIGFVWWNVLTAGAVWLFVQIWNKVEK